MKLALLSNLLFTLPTLAQEKDVAVVPSDEQNALEAKKLYAFLDEHFAGKTAELDAILKDEGEDSYKAVYDQQMQIYNHYHLMLRRGGQKLANLVIEQNKMYQELQPLLDAYEALDPEDPKRVEARAKVEPLLAKSNTFGGVWARVQIEVIKKAAPTKMTETNIISLTKKAEKMEALRKDPKKVFDDYIAYRESTLKKAAESKKNLPKGWFTDPQEAFAAAKKSGKPVHAFFSASWCLPCKAMIKNICPQEAVKEALGEYEALYVDGDLYGSFTRKYRVRMYPSFLILGADGEILRRSSNNAMDAETFKKWLTNKK